MPRPTMRRSIEHEPISDPRVTTRERTMLEAIVQPSTESNSRPRSNRLATLGVKACGMSLVLALLGAAPAFAGGGNSLSAKSCQKGGWTSLVTTTGARFAGETACVSYAAKGGVLKRPQTI